MTLQEKEQYIINKLYTDHGISIQRLPYGQWESIADPTLKKKNKSLGIIASITNTGEIICTVISHSLKSTLPQKITLCSKFSKESDDNVIIDDIEIQAWLKIQAEKNIQKNNDIKNARSEAQKKLQKDFPVLHEMSEKRYLNDKGIGAVGNIHVGWDDGGREFIAIPAYEFVGSKTARIKKNIGYQRIYENGQKYFQRGFSPTGTFFLLGEDRLDVTDTIYIVEGYATGVTIYECTGRRHAVFVAWNAGNLEPVAKEIRKHYPNVKIIGCADNDMWPNANGIASHAGLKYMVKAMNAVDGQFLLPDFDGLIASGLNTRNHKPTDFNDLYVLSDDVDLVADQLKNQPLSPKKYNVPQFHTAEQGTQKIRGLIGESINLNENTEPCVTVVNSTPGAGKTRIACEIIFEKIKNNPTAQISYYVPDHQLASEVKETLISLGLTRVLVLEGRGKLCKKNDVVNKIIQLGGGRGCAQNMCFNPETEKKCEHADGCEYLNQFRGDLKPQVIILQHAHLSLDISNFERQLYIDHAGPTNIIIDESFYHNFAREVQISRDDLYHSQYIPKNLKQSILSSLEWNTPLLMGLRADNFDSNTILKICAKMPSNQLDFTDITPDMAEDQQLQILSGMEQEPPVKKLLQLIAEELIETEHNECSGVHFVEKTMTIHGHYARDFKRHKKSKDCYVPVTIIDGSAKREIIESIFDTDKINFHTVDIHRNVYVTQLMSAAISKKSLAASDGYVKDVRNIADDMVKAGDKVMIIGPQSVCGNEKSGIDLHDQFQPLADKGVKFGHFGNIRGTNDFKECSSGIIVSRNQPPSHAVENLARAFFRLGENEIQTGVRFMPVAYSMRGENRQEFVNTLEMIDPRAQVFLDIIMKEETKQAMDRLRTIYHQGTPKNIVLFSNLPLDGIIIDELITTRDIRQTSLQDKMITLKNHFFTRENATLVMPCSPKILCEQLPDVFKNEKSAKNWLIRNGSQGIKEHLIRCEPFISPVTSISYRIKGKGGKSLRAIVATNDDDHVVNTLSKFHGGAEIVIEGEAIKSPKHQLDELYYNPMIHTSDDVLMEMLQYMESCDENQDTNCCFWHRAFYDLLIYLSRIENDFDSKEIPAYIALKKLSESGVLARLE